MQGQLARKVWKNEFELLAGPEKESVTALFDPWYHYRVVVRRIYDPEDYKNLSRNEEVSGRTGGTNRGRLGGGCHLPGLLGLINLWAVTDTIAHSENFGFILEKYKDSQTFSLPVATCRR